MLRALLVRTPRYRNKHRARVVCVCVRVRVHQVQGVHEITTNLYSRRRYIIANGHNALRKA